MGFLNTILNIVFPVRCVCCNKNGIDLCINCISSFSEPERETAEWIFPLYDYRHPPLRNAICCLKYKHKRRLAKIFAKIMYGRIIEELSDFARFNNFKNPILIPIPLASKRLRERGFNQSLLICNELVSLDKNVNFTLNKNILIKIKDGEHQANVSNKQKRIKNIINSFNVKNPEKISGKNVILIDDVVTTGATLSEAKKTLRKFGAKKIIAFTIAH